jgi:hypothetical protein
LSLASAPSRPKSDGTFSHALYLARDLILRHSIGNGLLGGNGGAGTDIVWTRCAGIANAIPTILLLPPSNQNASGYGFTWKLGKDGACLTASALSRASLDGG